MTSVELAPVARLLGLLLGRELDEETERGLRDPSVAEPLAELGLELPVPLDLDQLASEYFEEFLQPDRGTLLVQSVVEGGTYEGESAASVRAIGEAAGLEWNREPLRGAPVDHLATELFLWSELVPRDADAAAIFAGRHLAWAPAVLRRRPAAGFYGACRRVAADLIETILAEGEATSGPGNAD